MEETIMTLKTNPEIVLREEFDDWALLFDPETGNAFGLNPLGVYIWKNLDGTRTINDVINQIQKNYTDVTPEAEQLVRNFIDLLSRVGVIHNNSND